MAQQTRRVKRARDALKGGKYALGPDERSSVTDILADLMHYCKHRRISFDNHLRIARDHVGVELGDGA